jgi:hypothetical protein
MAATGTVLRAAVSDPEAQGVRIKGFHPGKVADLDFKMAY